MGGIALSDRLDILKILDVVLNQNSSGGFSIDIRVLRNDVLKNIKQTEGEKSTIK